MTIIFLLFSLIEALAVVSFMFRLFRFPIKEYLQKLTLLSIWSTGISFVIREVINFTEIDPLIQVLLFVLFFRISIQIKTIYSALIGIIGYLIYIVVQMIVYYVWILSDAVHLTDAIVTTNTGTYLVQISSILAITGISQLIYHYNLGFSFIIRPPHQLEYKEKWHKVNVLILVGLSAAVISIGLGFWLLLELKVFSLLPILVISLVFLYLLSDRRERTQND